MLVLPYWHICTPAAEIPASPTALTPLPVSVSAASPMLCPYDVVLNLSTAHEPSAVAVVVTASTTVDVIVTAVPVMPLARSKAVCVPSDTATAVSSVAGSM